MTQEDKELLLNDLCARLPYEVKVSVNSEYLSKGLIKAGYDKSLVVYGITADGSISFTLDKGLMEYSMPILSIKPYLFPLSSMTEEQKEELNKCIKQDYQKEYDNFVDNISNGIMKSIPMPNENVIEFYHKNHFDYRGLIPMGLAIDCTNLNIY